MGHRLQGHRRVGTGGKLGLTNLVLTGCGNRCAITALEPVQDIVCGGNPRQFVFTTTGGQEVLLVGVTGGVEVFDVSDEGLLTPRSSTTFAKPLANMEVCCAGAV